MLRTDSVQPTLSHESVSSAHADAHKFRSEIGKVSRHSAVFLAGTIFTMLAGYLFKIYVTRVLGAEALGIYTLGMSVVSLLGLFATLGLPNSASRFVAVYMATNRIDLLHSFLWRSLIIILMMSCWLGGLIVFGRRLIAEHIYHEPSLAAYLPLFALMLPLSGASFFFNQVLSGYQDVARRTVINSFIGVPVTVGMTFGLLALGWGLWGYVIAQVASIFVIITLMITAVWRLTPHEGRILADPPRHLEPQVISFAVSMMGIGIMEFLLGQSDRVVLGIYLDTRQIGIYSIAVATAGFIPILQQSVNSIFASVITNLHTKGEKDVLRQMYQTLAKWVLGLTSPLVLVVVLFAPTLMGIFGPDFEPGWPVLIILATGQLINCGVGSVGYLLLMSGNQNRLIRAQAIAGGLTVALNLLAIPLLGIIGAAFVGMISITVSSLLYLWEAWRALRLFPYNRSYLRLIGPLLMAGVVVFALRGVAGASAVLLMLAALLSSYFVFLIALFAFGLDNQDRVIIHMVWARLRAMLGKAPSDMAL